MIKTGGYACVLILLIFGGCSSTPSHEGIALNPRIESGAEAQIEMTPRRVEDPPYPGPDTPKLIALLRAHRFSELENYFRTIRAKLSPAQGQWDNGQEWLLIQSYKRISGTDADNQYDLNAWAEESPHSAEAIIALAFCNLDLSWSARGTDFIKNTSREQIQSMQMLSKLAEDYARQALTMVADDPAPYRVLIRAAHLRGAGEAIGVATIAISKFPLSYNLRVHLMESLQPRWGGSYEAMLAFAEASQQFAVLNPKMKVLLGFPYWARGMDLYTADDNKGALEQFTEALSFGDEIDFYDNRIKAELSLGRNDLADVDTATKNRLFPTGE